MCICYILPTSNNMGIVTVVKILQWHFIRPQLHQDILIHGLWLSLQWIINTFSRKRSWNSRWVSTLEFHQWLQSHEAVMLSVQNIRGNLHYTIVFLKLCHPSGSSNKILLFCERYQDCLSDHSSRCYNLSQMLLVFVLPLLESLLKALYIKGLVQIIFVRNYLI